MRFLKDHPRVVNTALLVLGVAAAFVSSRVAPKQALDALSASGFSLSLGVLSLGGVMAGFAGVIVVFGLQASAPVFVKFRVQGGKSLGRDWISIVSTSFYCAFASLGAAILFCLAAGNWITMALLWISILLSLHSALRLIWMLKILIAAVAIDDKQSPHSPAARKSAKELFLDV